MKSIYKVLLAVTLLFAINLASFGQATLERIVKKGELKVGLTGEQPPFAMKAKTGELIGYEIDMAKLLAQSMGVEVKFVKLPFDELIPNLEKGKIDMIMSGMTITPERNLRAAFVGPYMVSGKSILTKSSMLSKAETIDDVNQSYDMRIAVLEGSTSQTFAENFLENVDIVKVQSYDDALYQVRNDVVRAVIADFPFCVVSAMKYNHEGLVALDQPLTLEPIGVAIPKDDPLFMNLVQNYMNSLMLAGVFEDLSAKWLEDGSWLLRVE